MNLNDSALRTHIKNHGFKYVFSHLLPRERWMECDEDGCSKWFIYGLKGKIINSDPFIIYLIRLGISMKLPSSLNIFDYGFTLPLFEAICERIDTFQLTFRQFNNVLTRELHCIYETERFERIHILMKNGARLSSVSDQSAKIYLKPKLYIFERCILRCRRVVVTFLLIKKKLPKCIWDRYLLKDISRLVWSTRCDPLWKSSEEIEYENNLEEYRRVLDTKQNMIDVIRRSVDRIQDEKHRYESDFLQRLQNTSL